MKAKQHSFILMACILRLAGHLSLALQFKFGLSKMTNSFDLIGKGLLRSQAMIVPFGQPTALDMRHVQRARCSLAAVGMAW